MSNNNIFIILLLVLFFVSCKQQDAYQVSVSIALRNSWINSPNCKEDHYSHVMVKNDSLWVDGRVSDKWGFYVCKIKKKESLAIRDILEDQKKSVRPNKKYNPTTGITSFFYSRNSQVIDSLRDDYIHWSSQDSLFFRQLGKMICQSELTAINQPIDFPSKELLGKPKWLKFD